MMMGLSEILYQDKSSRNIRALSGGSNLSIAVSASFSHCNSLDIGKNDIDILIVLRYPGRVTVSKEISLSNR